VGKKNRGHNLLTHVFDKAIYHLAGGQGDCRFGLVSASYKCREVDFFLFSLFILVITNLAVEERDWKKRSCSGSKTEDTEGYE
jgi:hypothetical protein